MPYRPLHCIAFIWKTEEKTKYIDKNGELKEKNAGNKQPLIKKVGLIEIYS